MPLLLVHHFGVDHVVAARARALAAAARAPRAGRATRLAAGRRPRLLVQELGQLVRGLRQALRRLLDAVLHAFLDGLLGLVDGLPYGRRVRFRELVLVLVERLLRGVDERVRVVARLHLLAPPLVLVRVRLRFAHHLLDFVLGQPAGGGDRDVLGLARRAVLGRDVD